MIKLQHSRTNFLLHSHEVSYSYDPGSGQQSVTAYGQGDDFGSYWRVALAPVRRVDVATRHTTIAQGEPCTQGQSIPHNAHIRLQHQVTRRWLHSHLFKSPLSYNQEVSAFGDDNTSDSGDVWQLELEDASMKLWRRDTPARLRHKDTGFYLISHKCV